MFFFLFYRGPVYHVLGTLGPVSRRFRKVFAPEKPSKISNLTKLQSCFIFSVLYFLRYWLKIAIQSVIVFGNSTFQQNLDLETAKLHENQLFDLWFTRKTKKNRLLLVDFTRIYKTWNKCQFFSDKVDYFMNSSRLLLKSIFSSYCFNSFIAKKSKREISRIFSAFRRSHQNKKSLLFSAFSIWPPWLTAVKRWREMKRFAGRVKSTKKESFFRLAC